MAGGLQRCEEMCWGEGKCGGVKGSGGRLGVWKSVGKVGGGEKCGER